MVKSFLLLTGGVLATCVGLIGLSTAVTQNQRLGVVISPQSHDFGVCRAGEELQCRFQLRNSLDKPITGVTIRPSCGCTTVTTTPTTINPGTVVLIGVVFNTGTLHGHVEKRINVSWTHESNSYSAALNLTSLVESGYRVHPESIVFNHDEEATTKVRLSSSPIGEQMPEIKSTSTTTNALSAATELTAVDSNEVEIKITYNPNATPRLRRTVAAVSVQLNDQQQTRIEIPVVFRTALSSN